MRRTVLTLLLALGSAAAPAAAGAQVTERPAAFDSAGRVLVITPALASRLRLEAPAWPVVGAYEEARLYEGGGAHVLVVRRAGGVFERFPLAAEQRSALGAAVDAGLAASGRIVTEGGTEGPSRSAKGAFIRDQLILSSLVYAPALAELTNDATTGTGVYLLATGAAFFTAASVSRDINVSRAQQFLARDGAIRGALVACGLVYVADVRGQCFGDVDGSDFGEDDRNQNTIAVSVLVGGIVGSVFGFNYGKPLSDGEARATALGSSAAALTTLGALGSAGLLEDRDRGGRKAIVGSLLAAGTGGYWLGRTYARRASYGVTGGDVRAVRLAGILGTALAGSLVASSEPDEQGVSAALTAGFLGGLVVGDRVLARPFDHSEGEAFLMELGATAGGLMAAAVPVLGNMEEATPILVIITLGGIGGATVAQRLVAPRRAGGGASGARAARLEQSSSGRRPRVELSPEAAGLAAARVRGAHSILRVTF